jgi:flagellar biosynthetic protein FliQ
VSPDHALALFSDLLRVTLIVGGPILLAALVGGVFVGILQTATQINEASIGYAVKGAAVLAVLLVLGPTMAQAVVSYTRTTIESVAFVVR